MPTGETDSSGAQAQRDSGAQQRWDQRWAGTVPSTQPAEILLAHETLVRSLTAGDSAEAVDLAGGNGRNALWLAECGFATTLVDVSPVALEIASTEAGARGVALSTKVVDLESSSESITAGAPLWNLLVIVAYFNPDLLAAVPQLLAPGGVAFFAQPTATNLERHERPSRRFLLADQEVHALAATWDQAGLEIIEATQAWRDGGTHQGWLVARRPGVGASASD